MSFAVESWKRTLRFMVENPKVILFAFLVQLAGLVGWLLPYSWLLHNITGLSWWNPSVIELPRQYLPIVNLLIDIPTIPNNMGLGVILPGGSILLSGSHVYFSINHLLTVNHILDLIVSLIVYLIAATGFPIIVSQGFEQGRINLRLVFKDGLPRIFDVLLYVFTMLAIIVFSGVSGGLAISAAFISTHSLAVAYLLGFIFLLLFTFIMLRFWIALPVLMLGSRHDDSRKIGVLEALKTAYHHTSGNTLSILSTQVLASITVLLPFNLANFFLHLNYINTLPWHAYYSIPHLLSIPPGTLQTLLWGFTVRIFGGSFASILPTVYYYVSVRMTTPNGLPYSRVPDESRR